jgi:hypothetical protein
MLHHFFLPLNSSEERTDASNQYVAFFVIDKLCHQVFSYNLLPPQQKTTMSSKAPKTHLPSLPSYPPFF